MPVEIRGAQRVGGRLSIEIHCRKCGAAFVPAADDVRSGPSTYRYCERCRTPARDGDDPEVPVE